MKIKTSKNRKNRNGKTVRFKKMMCSPAVSNIKIHKDSCFTPDVLKQIQDKYNENHPENKIMDRDPKKVWLELKQKLNCLKEECWLNQIENQSMREQIKKNIFAPKHPPEWNNNPDEWLSNYDIMDVMKQYETSYSEFKFLGPTTIDFDTKVPEHGYKCVLEDLCNFSLERFISAKKTKIGIVFNLDKYYESGSHWVSMYIDITNRFIFFFDSADNEIPPEIWKETPDDPLPLVNRIIKQGLELPQPIQFTFYNNRGIGHQTGNTECGMYSLFFIITMLTGKQPNSKRTLSLNKRRDLFLKKRIPDTMVFQYRKLYFND